MSQWPFGDLRLKGMSPGLRTPMYPYVALRCPTYREKSHANHTWHLRSHETACFLVPAAPSPWVRFPSPAPLPAIAGECQPTRSAAYLLRKLRMARFLVATESVRARTQWLHWLSLA